MPADPSSAAAPWILPDATRRQAARALAAELGLPEAAGQVLLARGLDDPEHAARFLDPSIEELQDPATLPDLPGAAARLAAAIDSGEKIVVHGDYDADGICGTALLVQGLRRLGARVEPFVPDRRRDGYGVAMRLVEHAGRAGVSLLVTVDTGSSAHEALGRARALGIETIVCDHHLFDRRPEGADWLLNPQRADSRYAHRDLCGGGIAYQLLRGVGRLRGCSAETEFDDERALAAVATLADQVPLTGENRALVRSGLDALARTAHAGLGALLEVTRWRGGRIEADDIAYQVAPRLNAPGRIERARTTLELLLCADDRRNARALAVRIDALNRQRREMDQRVAAEAVARVEREGGAERAAIVLASPDWPLGIVGIAASRIVDRFDRPAVLLAIEEGEARGSARSAGGVDLKAALDLCAEHLTRYGGHAAAAGMTLPAEGVAAFAAAFEEAVAAQRSGSVPVAPVRVDALLGPADLCPELADFLYRCGPFGMGHPRPRFAGLALRSSRPARSVGAGGHLKLALSDGRRRAEFIGFSMAAAWLDRLKSWPAVDVAYSVRYREASEYDPWELVIRELRRAQSNEREEQA